MAQQIQWEGRGLDEKGGLGRVPLAPPPRLASGPDILPDLISRRVLKRMRSTAMSFLIPGASCLSWQALALAGVD